MFKVIIQLVILFTVIPLYGQDDNHIPDRSNAIKFLPNEGQIGDRSLKPRPDVLFNVAGKGIFLKDNGITYVMVDSIDAVHSIERLELEESHEVCYSSDSDLFNFGGETVKEVSVSIHQVSMVFRGMNVDFNIEKSVKSTDYLNYYLGQCPDGVEKVYSYEQVTYKDVYDGVDIQFFGSAEGDLKYDYILAPFADPTQIKLEWLGADSVFINDKGELVLDNQVKPFKESIPKAYQIINKDTLIVSAQYRLKHADDSNIVSFELGKYNPEYKLIIDPWVTNYGGDGVDGGRNLSTDHFGNIIVTGYTQSTTLIAEDGHMDVFGGIADGFIVKLSPEGDRIWGTFYGADDNDDMISSAVDADNNIICVGYTKSLTGIAFDGFQMARSGGSDGIIVKFDEAGTRIWSTYFGGNGNDYLFDVRISSAGDIYVAGPTGSIGDLATPGAHQTVFGGVSDLFVAKFNSGGDRIWATYCGGTEQEYGGGLGLDPDGSTYLAGTTRSSTGIASPGSHQEIYAGGERDAYLVKFDPDGNRVWGTYLGTAYQEAGADAITDTLGYVYITGDTHSETGMAFAGHQMTNAGPGDSDVHQAREAYLAKFDEDGVMAWATYVGGSNEDYGFSVSLDTLTNNVIISGDTYSSDYPTTGCGTQTSINPPYGENAFIAQFQDDGTLYCSSYFGVEHEEGTNVLISGCYIYLTGSSPANMSTPGAHQDFFGGNFNDGFIAQLYKFSCGLDIAEYSLEGYQIDISSCIVCDGTATVEVLTGDDCFDDKPINYKWSSGEEFLNSTETSSTVTDICASDDFWVEVELACGLIDTVFFDFTGGGAGFPVSDFSYDNLCFGETVNFTNLSTGTIVTYGWEFGDGNTSDLENPSHEYSSPGTYTVTLTTENEDGCIHIQTYEITIDPIFLDDVYISVCLDSIYTFPDGTQIQITEDLEEVTALETANGCDSIITTHITVIDGIIQYDTIYTAYNSQVLFPDGETELITENTEHTSVFESSFLCDSLIHTTVIIADFDFLPPNIFTPGEDGKNDLFYFPAAGIASFECVIVNRWGIQVFKFDSIDDKWDGVNGLNGIACVDGVYFYTYSGTFLQGDSFKGQGSLQLIHD